MATIAEVLQKLEEAHPNSDFQLEMKTRYVSGERSPSMVMTVQWDPAHGAAPGRVREMMQKMGCWPTE